MNSKIIICNGIHLHKDYKDVLSYSEQDMVTLCQNHALATANNYSFIRERGTIQVGIAYSTCVQANYIAYQNSDYSNKWFFAFVDEVRYKNNNTTEIVFTIDVWSTWFSYITFNSCFVEREHVTDDTIGLHTVPENLETGEYIITTQVHDNNNNNVTCVVASTSSPGELASVYGGYYNGIPSGIAYYRFDDITGSDNNSLFSFLSLLEKKKKSEAIAGMFLCPKWLCGGTTEPISVVIPTSNTVADFTLYCDPISQVDHYTPKNNKLLTFPYCYYNLTNNQGANAIYGQEFWETIENKKRVKVFGCLTPGCSIRAVPVSYKGLTYNYDEGINLGKLPQLNWTTDQYTNWLTQNGVNLAVKSATSAGTLAAGLLGAGATAGASASMVVSGVSGIANVVGEVYKHSLIPEQANGNLNSGDVTTAGERNNFHVYTMTIRQEYAKIIDDYFTARGYQVNTFKVPNINTRPIFNYVKINNETDSITGNFANNFTEKLNGILKSGVTIWHNHDNIDNYSLDNRIVNN